MITIIGGTGNVGGQTAKILLEKGINVRLVARHAEKLEQYKSQGAEIIVGDAKDSGLITEAFSGADAVLTMIPGNMSSPDIGKHQDELSFALVEAIKNSGVKYVVNVSSLGGHTEHKTGIVAGLARNEVRFNQINDVNIIHLRPTYFMENLFGNIPMIKNMNINGSAMKADVKLPIIATKDIAVVAADKLINRDFSGISVLPLHGDRDYTMVEATNILGNAIGKPELPYIEFSYEDMKAGLVQFGISESVANSYIGLMDGINEGVFNHDQRNTETTTPTSLEEFAKTFAFVYNS